MAMISSSLVPEPDLHIGWSCAGAGFVVALVFCGILISAAPDCSRAGLGFPDSAFDWTFVSAMTDDFVDLTDLDMICLSMCNGKSAVTEIDPGRPKRRCGVRGGEHVSSREYGDNNALFRAEVERIERELRVHSGGYPHEAGRICEESKLCTVNSHVPGDGGAWWRS